VTDRLRNLAYLVARAVAPAIALAALVPVAVAARAATAVRRRRGGMPRLIWGPEPLISIKYWSGSLRARGYESTTLVATVYPANSRGDFDRHRDEFLGDGPFAELVRDYVVFGWALLHADLFFSFFDGGYLRMTPLRDVEARLLRLAGKKIVVSPYGSDVAVPGHLGVAEERLLEDYPQFAETAEAVKERVDWFARTADVVVRNYQFGYVPRADVLWPTQLAIDTELWAEAEPVAGGGDVVVAHAPNHPRIKGTQDLLDCVERLRAEDLPVRVDLLTGRSNEDVREAIRAADVIADQFIVGYAMFAIEGMAAGKPVMSALSTMPPEVVATEAIKACPIVDTDLGSLEANLRRLIGDAELRRELGRSGREFALSHHSYDAVADGWEAVIGHLWWGRPLPRELP
jgi:glycosyltransferase involved in cell wall biosynthesis